MAPVATLRGERRRDLPSSQLTRLQQGRGSHSSSELRISGRANQEPKRSASLSELLPPVELRGFRALPALERSSSSADTACTSSQAPSGITVTSASGPSSAAFVAAAVLKSPSRRGATSYSDTDSDGDVSQFTASSCSTVRGYGYARSDSSRGSNSGLILGRRSRPLKSKRWSSTSKGKEDCICCPRGHELVFSERHKPWFCHGCGRVSTTSQMDCFRCNRCNYNLCDHCYSTQVSDRPPKTAPPMRERRPSSKDSSMFSLPASADDFFSRSPSEANLPTIPPGFSRKLSPSPDRSNVCTPTKQSWQQQSLSQMSTKSSWYSAAGSGRSQSRSKSPKSGKSSRRSSTSSANSPEDPRHGLVDPLLRIVSLSEWFVETGMFAEAADSIAGFGLEDKASAAQDLADIMVRGLSYGSPGTMASRNQARQDQIQAMAKCRFLPIEDVQEDLKIWHLTLLRRPSRKKLALQYGRVLRRNNDYDDEELLARLRAEEEGFTPRGTNKLGSGLSGSDGFMHGSSGKYGQSGSPTGGSGQGKYGSGGMYGSSGGRYGNDSDFYGDMSGLGKTGDGRFGDNQFGDSGREGQGFDPNDPNRKNGEGGSEADREGDDRFEIGANDPSRADSQRTGGREDGKSTSPGRHAAKGQRPGEQKKTEAQGKEKEEEGPTEEELQAQRDAELLASGALFRIKEIVAQVIYDEFAAALFPAPTLKRRTGGLDDGDDLEGNSGATLEDGTPSPTAGGPRRGSKIKRSRLPAVQPTSVPSSLAADFRKCLADAFRLIDNPAEAKPNKKEMDTSPGPDLMHDVEDDPALQKLINRSAASVHFKTDSTLLEQHLQIRAERHSRRLQKQTQATLQNKQDCWPRRLAACQQSLKATSPLDAFAEMDRRARVATA